MDELIEQLETHCVVYYCAVLNVRRYGDVPNREWLICMIVAIHKTFGTMATEYTIPEGDFDSNRVPQSRMAACPDNAVADHLCNYKLASGQNHQDSVARTRVMIIRETSSHRHHW